MKVPNTKFKECITVHCSGSSALGCCFVALANSSVVQQLHEMDFERGIWQAALNGDIERVRHFVNNRNVDPDILDSYGYTALHYAARNGRLDVARFLIEAKANVNRQTRNNGSTPLHRAVMAGHMAMVSLLLELGGDPSVLDIDGHTPLQKVGSNSDEASIEIIRILKNHNFKDYDT